MKNWKIKEGLTLNIVPVALVLIAMGVLLWLGFAQ